MHASRVFKPLPLKLREPVPEDIEIAQSQKPKSITRLAEEVGLLESELEPYGSYKAKVALTVNERLRGKPNGKYVVVTGFGPSSKSFFHIERLICFL